MPLTFETNYREIFSEETLKKIDEYLEDNYDVRDLIEFIDAYSEDDFLDFYEIYEEKSNELGDKVVDAFLKEFGISEIEDCERLYQGYFESPEEFAEWQTEKFCGELPYFLEVNWHETWSNLTDDFHYIDGHVFSKY